MNRVDIRLLTVAALCLLLVACSNKKQMSKDDEALGLDPQGSPAELYVKMAEAYFARRQTDEAFRHAQKALEADEKYPRAHAWTAFLYEEIGQKDRAQRHYDRAIELAPNNSDIRNAYGSFFCRQKRYAEADAQFAKAVENPLYGTPWVAATNAGNCAMTAGNATKAETYYRSAITANPNYGPALAKLAESAFNRGDTQAAKGYLDRYFEPKTMRTPNTAYAALTLGVKVERKLGNRKQAAFYEQVLKNNYAQAPKTKDI
jgi:type IV pilus assembly protein PilF